jgi:glycerophosphoryl diester phosphodiesterase
MHDDKLRRTAGVAGALTDHRAADLQRFDVGRWHSPRFAGERIPLLAVVLETCRAQGVWINVEIKPAPGRDAATGRVVAGAVAEAFADRLVAGGATPSAAVSDVPLLSSFSIEALEAARVAAPDLPRGWLVHRVPRDWRARLSALGAVALHADQAHLGEAGVRAIKETGAWLFCYTVNDPARARQLFAWGVDAICTDRIDVIGADFVDRGLA